MFLTKLTISIIMPMYRLLMLLFIIFILPSCTHIHVPADATLANGLKEDFSKVTANDSNIYSAMLDNKEQMEAKEQLRLESLLKEKGVALANQVYTKKWEEIQTELVRKEVGLTEQLKVIDQNLNDIDNRLKEIGNKKEINNNTLIEAKELLNKAAKEQNQWFARHELFRQSLEKIAEKAVDEESDANLDTAKTIQKARDEILNSEITIIVVDNNGKVGEGKQNIKTILEIDEENMDKDRFINLIKANSGNLFDPEAAPGIKIIILGLAVDLADKELKRNKLDLDYLQEVINILEEKKESTSNVNETIEIIGTAKYIITDEINEKHFKKGDTVLETINILRKDDAEKESVQDAFKAIGIYSKAMMNDDVLLQELQLAMLDHEYSIKLSSINAQEHEALISRGLQGVAAYHEGGITPETIANFLRAAQAVALGVIGAGVL